MVIKAPYWLNRRPILRSYVITPAGDRYRRLASNQSRPETQVLNFIARQSQANNEHIEEFCGLNRREASIVLRYLKAKGLVQEV
jgi:hypothetical protein